MLKINASYSKKVPAETEYSSQSYHCTIESELPDGLTHQSIAASHEFFSGLFELFVVQKEKTVRNRVRTVFCGTRKTYRA
jgi:hypothetical protein